METKMTRAWQMCIAVLVLVAAPVWVPIYCVCMPLYLITEVIRECLFDEKPPFGL